VNIERVGELTCGLGEGPVWDVSQQALYFTDVLARKVRRFTPASGAFAEWHTPQTVSALALDDAGAAVLAMSNGVYSFDFDSGACVLLGDPEAQRPLTILNDGKTDRRGRFLFGSVATDRVSAVCGLYRLECGVISRLDDGFTITNGPCFSPDGATFYFADSVPHALIYAYDYDLETGTLRNRREFAGTRDLGGFPDGATVDAAGRLWTAVCGAGKIACYEPNGALCEVIAVPPRLVSSLAFGGPRLDELYVTSIDAAALQFDVAVDNAGGGQLFVITGTGARGLPETRYRAAPAP
jgi:sugar lactone lactonase YvrE